MFNNTSVAQRTSLLRFVIVLVAIGVVIVTWYSIRIQLADLLATSTQDLDPNLEEKSQIAKRWSPSSPASLFLAAKTAEFEEAISNLEEAVRLAPFDYRRRIELGRAYEQSGEDKKAEEQFLFAARLAPNYSAVRWHLGNFFLRQGENARAFAELKKAAINSPVYREQVFSLVWDSSSKDPVSLERLVGEDPELRARLAYFFAARGYAADSLRIWNLLDEAEKTKSSALASSIALGLFDQKYFAEALEFGRQYGAEPNASSEQVTNGDFELPVLRDDQSRFDWSIIRGDPKFEAAPDSSVKRSGNRSLRLTFKGYSKAGLSNILQTVVVRPGMRYRLTVFIRTENLRSAGPPILEVLNAKNGESLAIAEPSLTGSNDWKQVNLDLTVPQNSTGIVIRTTRKFCGEDCPITGIVWYDDIVLSRV